MSMFENAQCLRMHCVEIIGISNTIVHSEFEKMACKVLQHIAVDICDEKIESCHRLNKRSDNSKISLEERP